MKSADPDRCGVLVSSGIGGISTIIREHSKSLEKGYDRVSPFFIPMSIINMASGRIAINTGFHGRKASSVVTACAGSANAVGDAMRMIRHGYLDAVICGGTGSAVLPLTIGGFTSMKALCETDDPSRASIPFDLERSGFVLGEGAGILVLEELEHAKARRNIYAGGLRIRRNVRRYHTNRAGAYGQIWRGGHETCHKRRWNKLRGH